MAIYATKTDKGKYGISRMPASLIIITNLFYYLNLGIRIDFVTQNILYAINVINEYKSIHGILLMLSLVFN